MEAQNQRIQTRQTTGHVASSTTSTSFTVTSSHTEPEAKDSPNATPSSTSSLTLAPTLELKDDPSTADLPPFNKMSTPTFKWGLRDAYDFIKDVERAYEIITKWRKNIFKLPSGHSGKHFTQALSKLFAAYGERSPLESISLKAAAIITPLLLQQPLGKPTYRDNVNHLSRRPQLWEEGNIKELLKEGGTIQAQLAASKRTVDDSTLAKRFATMVFNNNFKGAMSLVTEKGKGGIMPVNDKTKKEMASKHPKPEPIHPEALLSGELPPSLHPVFYSALDGELVKKCALRTKGGSGVSQQEDGLWHKMVTGHKDASSTLCNAVATVARRLATEYVDPIGLEALLANRGIAIDKCPGLRPVGVGEIVRRVIGKAVMSVTGVKVQEAVGALQLCAGQPAGVESAIHAMRGFLDDDERWYSSYRRRQCLQQSEQSCGAAQRAVRLPCDEARFDQLLSVTHTHFYEW
jgi:hypothetical protein